MSTSPYPGLRPFHRDEADIFFGRDEQVDQLLIRLGKSRFLAVVGPSGCGKSSLVHTCLLNALEAGLLADAGLHWRIATMQPGSHPMQNLAAALVDQVKPIDLSSAKPSPAGEGWVRGNQNKEKSLIITPHPNLLPEGEGAHVLKSTVLVEQVSLGTNTNPASESDITSFSDTGTTSTANEKPQHDDTAFLLATLRRGPLGLIEALREQPLPENTNLLLVVDQFEEIFRYREHQDRDEADAFVALLLRSVQDSAFPVYIVITMRSDFLGDCALFPGLPEALNDSQFLTPRLNREQRRLAITGPARVCGGDVEPALVNRLLNDMGADPDQLPVLQHALMRLWTDAVKQDNKPVILKIDDYETLGGWDNTLSNHADEAFAELDEKQQTIAEIVFRALTERSGAKRDTRRPVFLKTVAGIAGVGIEQVIEVFRRSDRSFVMPPEGQPLTAETLIDISHESLIRQWQRMKEWVEQEAQSADTYRRLEQTALLHSQKRAGLLQGLDLLPVLAWKKREQPSAAWAARYGKDFNQAMRFLAASERRHMLKSIGKLIGFAAICLTAVWMTWLWHQADTERHKATGARLLAEGQLLRSQDPLNDVSILLGIEAWKHYPTSHFALNQFLLASLGMLPKLGHFLPHDGSVSKVVFSSDGKRLASASDDNTARLWDAATGRELQRLRHDGAVKTVTFSPDGKQLATASDDKTARLWDATTGKELQYLRHYDTVYDVTFSPDGKQLATVNRHWSAQARLWDVATGKELQRLHHDSFVNAVIFSPDGKQLATASWDNSARLWDAATGKELHRLNHDGPVNAVTFSPDGKQLATASEDKTARMWDTATGQELQRLSQDSSVNDVAFSLDGKQLATASRDNSAQLWYIATGQELQRLNHDDLVYAVTFNPDGKQLATKSYDMTARLWDTATGREVQRLSRDGNVAAVTFSPDGKQLATMSYDMTARLWDAATGQEVQRLSHDGSVTDVTFSPDGKLLVTASDDKTARLWDAATGKELQRLNHDDRVHAVTFSPDGKHLATASEDNTARLWDTATGKETQRMTHNNYVIAVSFSPDGKQLATASWDKTARLWDTATGRELQRLSHDDKVTSVSFSPDGKQLATEDDKTRLWDTATGRELQHLNHDGAVSAVTFSPDGKQFATSRGADKTVQLWDTATGKELQRLRHKDTVSALSFSPDGKYLVTGIRDFSADLRDPATGKALTVTPDNSVHLWDTATGQELQRLHHESYITAVTFSPDGKQLATASSDMTARLWLWQPEDLINQLCSRLIHNLTWDDWQNYFEDEPYRKTCDDLAVAPEYQEKGKQLVREGKTVEAVRMIKQLNAADPALKLDQVQILRIWTELLLLEEVEQLLQEKKITEAIAAFNRVEQMDSKVISANSWNKLCESGALGGHPSQVLTACEKAVHAATAEERWMYQASRGLARALTGTSQGAIEDFDVFIQKTSNEQHKKQCQAWVQALRAGQNPFTKEELATLRDE